MIKSRESKISIESVVSDILSSWSKEDLDFVNSCEYDFGMIRRRIRNDLKLWDPENPLTADWHSGKNRDIRGFVDHTPSHPDNLSGLIVDTIREKLKGI